MAVVVTRPLQEARRWAERLHARGIDAIVLPLIEIAPSDDAQPLREAAANVSRYAAVMFVSANAVQAFFALAPQWGDARAWAPGPATRESLRAAGVAPDRIDAPAVDAPQFDSESLWQQVGGQLRAGDRLLLVRGGSGEGGEGREWLAQQLATRGVQVDAVAAYARRAPDWSDGQQAAARRAAGDGSLWLFSSSEAARNLRRLLPAQDWSAARALATHPRIAATVRSLGFGDVAEARPGFEEVVASIESRR